MSAPSTYPKQAVCDALLERGSVFLHLDPRREGVCVPSWLKSGPQLVLQLGFAMPISIPDLATEEDGVVATLSFQRAPFTCWIPWEAIFALVNDEGEGMVWPESLPSEITKEMSSEDGAEVSELGQFLFGESSFDADPLHAPSEVRSSVTSRPLRLVGIDAAVSPPSKSAIAATKTQGTIGKTTQRESSATRAVEPAQPSSDARPSRPPHLRLVK